MLAAGIAQAATPKKKGYQVKRLPENAPAIKNIVQKYAVPMGVPMSLVMAIIGIESGYNTLAQNHSERATAQGGAWGLGQMTLNTAKDITKRYPEVAKQYWPTWNGTGQGLLDPYVNGAMTSFLLSLAWKKYAKYPNRWLTAGVAHHQGMGKVDELLKKYGKVTQDILVKEKLPFGAQYYGMIEREHQTNPLVASLYTGEIQSGAVYA